MLLCVAEKHAGYTVPVLCLHSVTSGGLGLASTNVTSSGKLNFKTPCGKLLLLLLKYKCRF